MTYQIWPGHFFGKMNPENTKQVFSRCFLPGYLGWCVVHKIFFHIIYKFCLSGTWCILQENFWKFRPILLISGFLVEMCSTPTISEKPIETSRITSLRGVFPSYLVSYGIISNSSFLAVVEQIIFRTPPLAASRTAYYIRMLSFIFYKSCVEISSTSHTLVFVCVYQR